MANELAHILDIIDTATEPKVMSKEKAKDFLEELIDELKSRVEALGEEIANGA
jgi:polyhydroxyalkanoate synthesis regulator phasin